MQREPIGKIQVAGISPTRSLNYKQISGEMKLPCKALCGGNFAYRAGIAEGWGIEFRQARQPKLINDLLLMIYS